MGSASLAPQLLLICCSAHQLFACSTKFYSLLSWALSVMPCSRFLTCPTVSHLVQQFVPSRLYTKRTAGPLFTGFTPFLLYEPCVDLAPWFWRDREEICSCHL